MNDSKKIVEQIESNAIKIIGYIGRHRTIIVIFIACTAIFASIMQAQSYLNPVRNEDKYTEVQSSSNTKKIDPAIVEKLSKTQEDYNSTADSSFVPDRSNPFAE
jgi:hypothetical protein